MTFTNQETKVIRSIIVAFIYMAEVATERVLFNIEKDPNRYFRFVDCLEAAKDILHKIDTTTELQKEIQHEATKLSALWQQCYPLL